MSEPVVNRRTSRRWRGASFYLLAIAVMLSPLVYLWVSSHNQPPVSQAQTPAPPSSTAAIRTVAEVVGLTRQLKLSTVAVETIVRSEARDPRWNGTASAQIEARARHSFGIDLATISQDSVRYSADTGAYELTLPAPQRISIEINLSRPDSESVSATGLRLRSLSGRDQLLRAQKALYDAARNQQLSAELLAEVRKQSAEQVEALLSKLLDGH